MVHARVASTGVVVSSMSFPYRHKPASNLQESIFLINFAKIIHVKKLIAKYLYEFYVILACLYMVYIKFSTFAFVESKAL